MFNLENLFYHIFSVGVILPLFCRIPPTESFFDVKNLGHEGDILYGENAKFRKIATLSMNTQTTLQMRLARLDGQVQALRRMVGKGDDWKKMLDVRRRY